jgi:uncharacterized protein (DUF58 family)
MIAPELRELVGLRAAAQALGLRTAHTARAPRLGGHRSAQRGRGLEFEEVRGYVHGDDLRSIDWRVTARRGRVHTKLFREERERPAWLFVDLRCALYFGSRLQLKSALAVRAAAMLAWAAAGAGDRVGAVLFNDVRMQVLPPRGREAGVLALLDALVALQPRAPLAVAPASAAMALQALLASVRPGSATIAISDFADAGIRERPAWSALCARGDCRWFWITDPLEEQSLPDGRFRASDGRREDLLDGQRVRDTWRTQWQQRATSIRTLCNSLQLPLARLDTASPVLESLGAALAAPERAA